jgi:hypothetical protein
LFDLAGTRASEVTEPFLAQLRVVALAPDGKVRLDQRAQFRSELHLNRKARGRLLSRCGRTNRSRDDERSKNGPA